MNDRKLKILLVDDEPELLNILTEEFIYWGHTVYSASSVEQALQLLDEKDVSLVLSDVRMPNGSGLELLSKTEVPVVLTSGYSDVSRSAALQKGAVDLIAKPFELNDLVQEMVDILQHHRI